MVGTSISGSNLQEGFQQSSAGPSASAAALPTLEAEEWTFLKLINDFRVANGAGTLQVSAALQNSSEWMSTDMAAKNYFSHTDSLGRSAGTRIKEFGYTYPTWWGENIAAGNSTAQGAFNQWRDACDPDSTGACTYAHRVNMLNPNFKVIGIGRAYGATSTYKWYWTTDFGGFIDQTVPPPGAGCDVDGDGTTNVLDVQRSVNQALSVAACTADINLDGICNVLDVQRISNAALGGPCATN